MSTLYFHICMSMFELLYTQRGRHEEESDGVEIDRHAMCACDMSSSSYFLNRRFFFGVASLSRGVGDAGSIFNNGTTTTKNDAKVCIDGKNKNE